MTRILLCAILFASAEALAGTGTSTGPNSLGEVSIGMSKADYLAATKSSPVDCNAYRDKDGKARRSELKYLTSERKTLCYLSGLGNATTIENIQVGEISYDVIEANYGSNEFIKSVGHSSKAIFLNDRLISLEIYAPKVTIEILMDKYGVPKLDDRRKVEVCKNRIGNEFSNSVGRLDAVWVNGEVRSILRVVNSSPRETCTDDLSMQYYILENRRQLEIIENAIDVYRNTLSREAARDTKF